MQWSRLILQVQTQVVDFIPRLCHLCYLSNIHSVSKNDSDVAHYNFNAHQLILVILGRDAAE